MRRHSDLPSRLFQSNVGPENPSRIAIAIAPAQLLKGDVMVSALLAPWPCSPIISLKGKTVVFKQSSLPAPTPARRMKNSFYLRQLIN